MCNRYLYCDVDGIAMGCSCCENRGIYGYLTRDDRCIVCAAGPYTCTCGECLDDKCKCGKMEKPIKQNKKYTPECSKCGYFSLRESAVSVNSSVRRLVSATDKTKDNVSHRMLEHLHSIEIDDSLEAPDALRNVIENGHSGDTDSLTREIVDWIHSKRKDEGIDQYIEE